MSVISLCARRMWYSTFLMVHRGFTLRGCRHTMHRMLRLLTTARDRAVPPWRHRLPDALQRRQFILAEPVIGAEPVDPRRSDLGGGTMNKLVVWLPSASSASRGHRGRFRPLQGYRAWSLPGYPPASIVSSRTVIRPLQLSYSAVAVSTAIPWRRRFSPVPRLAKHQRPLTMTLRHALSLLPQCPSQ